MKAVVSLPGGTGDGCFPKIMWDPKDGFTLLVDADRRGMVLAPGKSQHGIGHFSDNWTIEGLVDYPGTVTLEND